jgi:hypothetical protein
MADNKQPAQQPATRPQPPKPPEVTRRATGNGEAVAAAPATASSSTPAPAPTAAPVFTPPAADMSVDALKAALNEAHGKAAEARPPTELELAIEKVRELIDNRDDKNPAPCAADKLSADQKRALFQAIFEIEAKIQAAKDVIEAEGVRRTWAVLSLITTYGGKTGKWTVNGVGLKARARGDSWFLMRPDQDEGEVL